MRRAVPPPQGEGFLSRWSRLKREPEPAPVPAEPAPPAAAEPTLPEGRTLEDLIAELPKVEDLVPGQSLSAFMQPWVPTPLRNAALQRMWLLDPAIRDYVSPALDYAYDYNTPGAAPGFGPIETTQDMIREVADLFDRALSRAPGDTAPGQDHDKMSREAGQDHVASQQDGASVGSRAGLAQPQDPSNLAMVQPDDRDAGHPIDGAVHKEKPAEIPLIAPRKRHGGALPG